MLHDIQNTFDNHWENHSPKLTDMALAFDGNKLLFLDYGSTWELPQVEDILRSVDARILRSAGLKGEGQDSESILSNGITAISHMFTYLFSIGSTRYFLVLSPELLKGLVEGGKNTPENFVYHANSEFRTMEDHDLSFICQVGLQLHNWYSTRRFCGHCGSKTQLDTTERMIKCPECGTVEYPKICPGVIVGVIHEGKLLMSRYLGRPYTAHALIAGFSEIGEPIEDTVHREVMEETGLKVKNITFFGSQPWPPSSSLLVGFFCEVDGSPQITVDTTELAEAGWYSPEDVPGKDDNYSLTRKMMVFFHNNADHPERMVRR